MRVPKGNFGYRTENELCEQHLAVIKFGILLPLTELKQNRETEQRSRTEQQKQNSNKNKTGATVEQSKLTPSFNSS